MRNPTITPAYNEHRNSEMVSLRFEKGFEPGDGSSKTTEIYPVGSDYINHQISESILLSNGGNTHVSQKDFAKFKNPFDDDFFDSS